MVINKYIILLMCALYYLEAMDGPVVKTAEWNSKLYDQCSYSPHDIALLDIIHQHQQAFIGSTVLPYDGYEAIPKLIAQTAQVVHVDNSHLLETEQYHHARIKYTKPQPNTYDYIVICNPENLKKDIIRESFRTCYTLLKSSGKLVSVIRLQTDVCILQKAFDQLYPEIRSTISPPQHLQLNLPHKQNFNSYLFSYDELIKTCTIDNLFSYDELGSKKLYLFEIESYQPKIYNIIIKDQDGDAYLDWLKLVFNVSTQDWRASLCDGKDHNPSHKIMESLQKQFIVLVLQQLARDTEGNLLHPFNMTELVWRKWVLPIYKTSKPKLKSKSTSSWPLERRSKNYEK